MWKSIPNDCTYLKDNYVRKSNQKSLINHKEGLWEKVKTKVTKLITCASWIIVFHILTMAASRWNRDASVNIILPHCFCYAMLCYDIMLTWSYGDKLDRNASNRKGSYGDASVEYSCLVDVSFVETRFLNWKSQRLYYLLCSRSYQFNNLRGLTSF